MIYDSVEGACCRACARVAGPGICPSLCRASTRAAPLRPPAADHSAPSPLSPLSCHAEAKKVEPRHRLISSDLGGTKKTRSRKQWKELKKKKRVTWGTGRREAARMAKKAAAA